MKANGMRRTITDAVLTLVMLLGTVVVASASAQAQYRHHDQDNQYGIYGNQARWDRDRERRYAYLLGYHTAYAEGRDTRGRRVSYKDMPGYREGTNGLLTWMGDRNTYRDYYRKGYKDGFEDGQRDRARRYGRNEVESVLGARLKDVYSDDRYDRDPYYGDRRDRDDNGHRDAYGRNDLSEIHRLAQQNGHRDGSHHGEEDRGRRRNYDYEHSGEYRDGLRGYRSEYGDRELYRNAYRDGYRRGYDEGYRR